MATAFQPSAFQNNAFQIDLAPVVDTNHMPLPVNCWLADDVKMVGQKTEIEGKVTFSLRDTALLGGSGRLAGPEPSFKVTQNKWYE